MSSKKSCCCRLEFETGRAGSLPVPVGLAVVVLETCLDGGGGGGNGKTRGWEFGFVSGFRVEIGRKIENWLAGMALFVCGSCCASTACFVPARTQTNIAVAISVGGMNLSARPLTPGPSPLKRREGSKNKDVGKVVDEDV